MRPIDADEALRKLDSLSDRAVGNSDHFLGVETAKEIIKGCETVPALGKSMARWRESGRVLPEDGEYCFIATEGGKSFPALYHGSTHCFEIFAVGDDREPGISVAYWMPAPPAPEEQEEE